MSLRKNDLLQKLAHDYANLMATKGIADHQLDGKTSGQRIKAAGYRFINCGENVAGGQKSAKGVIKSWMLSEGHKENILRQKFKDIGVGVGRSTRGRLYFCQLFAAPRTGGRDVADSKPDVDLPFTSSVFIEEFVDPSPDNDPK